MKLIGLTHDSPKVKRIGQQYFGTTVANSQIDKYLQAQLEADRKGADEHNSVAISEAYLRGRAEGLVILEANVEQIEKEAQEKVKEILVIVGHEVKFAMRQELTKLPSVKEQVNVSHNLISRLRQALKQKYLEDKK